MASLKKVPVLLQWILVTMLSLLMLMTLYRFFFFYTYSQEARPISGSAFLLGLRYDARIVSVIGLVMLLICILPLINPFKNPKAKTGWVITLTAVFFVFIIVYVTDFYHYDYLKQRLSASLINFLPDAKISFGMMWQTYPLVSIIVGMAALLTLYAWANKMLLKKLMRGNAVSSNKWFSRSYFIFAAFAMAILIFGRIGQYPLRWSDAFALGDDFKGQAALNPFQSFFSSLKFRNASYDIKKVKAAYPLMVKYLDIKNPDINTLNFERKVQFPDGAGTKPNIVVVICESFMGAKSSMFGNPLNPTPFFNQLCNQGIFFERCFTPAFGTARGVWATVTGVPDVQSTLTASRNPAAVNQHTIINDFTDYSKYYFLGGSTSWANIRGLLTNNIEGLKIIEEDSYDAATVDVWGISDKELFLAANKKLAAEKKPFFAIIQTADNHRPYTIPEKDKKEFKLVSYPADTLKKYTFSGNDELNAFRYSDFAFQKFMNAAAKEKYFANTIFVFVGDHGLRGGSGDLFPESFTREGFGAEHVPLLFYAPALLPAQKIRDVSSQLDILPSLAYLARQPHRNTSMGRNLFDSTSNREMYSFIADPDTRFIGLVGNHFYFGKNLVTGKKVFVSVENNEPVVVNPYTDSIKNYMDKLNDGCYETARYLLLNNKKE